MKKIIALLLVLVMALGLIACGNTSTNDNCGDDPVIAFVPKLQRRYGHSPTMPGR